MPGGPDSALQIDFGKFDTLYGAEVAEAQDNMNYTRGLVYWLAQPLFHTGFRLSYEAMPELTANLIAVNGYNNTIDNNAGKTLGAQLVISPAEQLGIALGWIGGPEQDDTVVQEVCVPPAGPAPNGDPICVDVGATEPEPIRVDRGGANSFDAWRHLIDLVVNFEATPDLSFVFNADYGVEGVRTDTDVENQTWYGGMLGARYALTETWAIAGRGEYYGDPDGYTTGVQDGAFASGTLTIDAMIADFLLIRLDNRGDFQLDGTPDQAFPKGVRDTADTQFTTTLGVIATTP
jgi:hypothetical protein